MSQVDALSMFRDARALRVVSSLNLEALMHEDVQLLHLIFGYPDNTDIDAVEKHDVGTVGDQLHNPSRNLLAVEDVTSESTQACNVQCLQISSHEDARRVTL